MFTFTDTGLNFLIVFFVFWTLLIVVGIILEFVQLGLKPGHMIERIKELYRNLIERLEHPDNHRHKRT